jgi:hypothetical protein
MPSGKLWTYGLWEHGRFKGAVMFGAGATPNIGSPYGLKYDEVLELVRVALGGDHATPTSKVVMMAVRFLRRQMPKMRLLVSYADPRQGHAGVLYQACGWTFVGEMEVTRYIFCEGKIQHPRSLGARFGKNGQSLPSLRAHVDPHARSVVMPRKLKYLCPLEPAMSAMVAKLKQPYPKAEEKK